MKIVRYTDATMFAEVARPFLMTAEAEHNLLLGIAAGLPSAATPAPYLATVEHDGRIVAAALMTPPHNLVLSTAPRDALAPLCADLADGAMSVPGVSGRVDVADTFASLWRERTGREVRRQRDLRNYELSSVIATPPIPGRFRHATPEDGAIVGTWARRFVEETGVSESADEVARSALRAADSGRLALWDDGRPATMAAWTGPTPNGARVTLVYTPPALRGRGYASACVAALSASLLASGRTRCFLFADLANPTSNHIYTAIGYRPVCDVREYRFAG